MATSLNSSCLSGMCKCMPLLRPCQKITTGGYALSGTQMTCTASKDSNTELVLMTLCLYVCVAASLI